MKLVIAEKPSQAKEYANALGGFVSKDGYLENNEYLITWCFGHLIELERDTAYREAGNWNKSYLPLVPEKYIYKVGSDSKGNVDSGKKKQLGIIKNLVERSSEIINATDADREGELIFLYVYNYLNISLPFKRLWISSLTDGDIKKGFNRLLSPEEIKNLGKSAYARAIADWLVGVNGTQAATLQFGKGTLLTIGRVQTAILKIICERFIKHKNHQKTYTYRLRASHVTNVAFYSETEIFESKNEAENTLLKLSDGNKHTCVKVEKTQQKKNPPLLFSIDSLIVESNKKFGYSGQQTLDTAQALYEKKLTSYPRTDSEYINEENFSNLKNFIPEFSSLFLGFDFSFSFKTPKSVNEKKLTGSHDAIVPTGMKPILSELTQIERDIYLLILRRCLQAFSDEAVYNKKKFIFENKGIEFFSYSSNLVSKGWKQFEIISVSEEKAKGEEEEQEIDFEVNEGDVVNVNDISLKEIESRPPALFTDATLTQDLTNFGKLLKEENPKLLSQISSNIDINSLQIGTQATRPGIIEKLIKMGFIAVVKNKYGPTEKGFKYYQIIKDLEVSNVLTTAIWEMKLKKVSEGIEDIKLFYGEIKDFTTKIVNDIFLQTSDVSFNVEKSILGVCLKCKKGNVFEGKFAYQCSEWKEGCDFKISKIICKKKISETNVRQLLEKRITNKINGFVNKAGSKFDAKLKLKEDYSLEFSFDNKK